MIKTSDKPLLYTTGIVIMFIIALMISGCAGTTESGGIGQHKKTLIGGLGGAAAGGLIAAALHGGTAGIIGGVLAGGLIGGAQKASQQALEKAPSGTAVAWHNPDSGHSGTVTPVRTFQKNGGQYCREYQQTISIGGQEHQAYGTACRQPDGSWKVVK